MQPDAADALPVFRHHAFEEFGQTRRPGRQAQQQAGAAVEEDAVLLMLVAPDAQVRRFEGEVQQPPQVEGGQQAGNGFPVEQQQAAGPPDADQNQRSQEVRPDSSHDSFLQHVLVANGAPLAARPDRSSRR